MAQYRKRPIKVEAEQWFPGKNIPGVTLRPARAYYGFFQPYVTTIQEQYVSIKAGEWVIQEGDGVHAYPCDPIKFAQLYEPCPALDDPAMVPSQATPDAAFIDPLVRLGQHLLATKPALSKSVLRVCLEFDDAAQASYTRWLLYHAIEGIPCPAASDNFRASTAKED